MLISRYPFLHCKPRYTISATRFLDERGTIRARLARDYAIGQNAVSVPFDVHDELPMTLHFYRCRMISTAILAFAEGICC